MAISRKDKELWRMARSEAGGASQQIRVRLVANAEKRCSRVGLEQLSKRVVWAQPGQQSIRHQRIKRRTALLPGRPRGVIPGVQSACESLADRKWPGRRIAGRQSCLHHVGALQAEYDGRWTAGRGRR